MDLAVLSRHSLCVVGLVLLPACVASIGRPATMAHPRDPLACPEQWSPERPYRFLVLGDTQRPGPGKRPNDAERGAIYERMLGALTDSSAAFIFHVGDIVSTGSKGQQWCEHFDAPFWDRLAAPLKQRFFPIPGNHEYKSHLLDYGGDDLAQYFARFTHLDHRRYYHFFYGRACFVALDSGRNGIAKVLFGERWQNGFEEQVDWLTTHVFPRIAERVAVGQLDRVFVFFHKPAYSTPVTLRNQQSAQVLSLFGDLNRDSGYRLRIMAFSGHIHTFAHMRWGSDGDGRGTIDQFTTGGGGGAQRGWKYYRKVTRIEDLDEYRREKYWARAEAASVDTALFTQLRRDNTHFGYLEVVVDDGVQVIYHRFDPDTGGVYRDYGFNR